MKISEEFRNKLRTVGVTEVGGVNGRSVQTAPGKPAPSWSHARIRLAKPIDAKVVADWVEGSQELQWLGGGVVPNKEVEIRGWIDEACGAFVLEIDGRAVAFINVAPLDWGSEAVVEVGRLVVAPQLRRRGIGSTLLQHTCTAIVETAESGKHPPIHSRTHVGNVGGNALIAWMPFSRMPQLPFNPNPSERYYRYRLQHRPSRLTESMKKLREKRKLTQADLSFQSGESRSLISMIEKGKRNPGPGTFQHIYQTLAAAPEDEIELLYSLVGEEPSRSVHVLQTIRQEGADYEADQDLWVISDTLAEDQPPLHQEFLRASLLALRNKKQRYYFLPKWKVEGAYNRFEAAFDKAEFQRFYSEEKRLRFFVAPPLVCSLRAAIHEPGLGGTTVQKITFEGQGGARVPLSSEMVKDFYLALVTILNDMDRKSALEKDPEIEGFREWHPRLKGTPQ